MSAEALTHVMVFSAEGSNDTHGNGAPETFSGTMDVYLDGPSSRTLTVVVLQGYIESWVEAHWQWIRVKYLRTGMAKGVAADTSSVTQVPPISLTPVESPLASVEVQAGPWLQMTSAYARLELPGMAPLESLMNSTGSTSRSFMLPVPPFEGAAVSVRVIGRASLEASVSRNTRTGFIPLQGSGPTLVRLTQPPDLVLPLNRSEFTGKFLWSRPDPGPCVASISTSSGNVEVHTEGREVTSSDLQAAGLSLKSSFGSSYGSWDVRCPDGFTSLEDAMANPAAYAAALEWETSTALGLTGSYDFYLP